MVLCRYFTGDRQPEGITAGHISGMDAVSFRNEEVYIPDVQQLTDTWSAEKIILESQGIQSLLALPVTASGKLFGFIGFDAVQHRIRWEKPQRQLLQLLADNVGSVILRHQQSRYLREVSERAQQLAEAANRASRFKSEFLANMSHEMRTPLHGILGFSDVLMQSGLKPEQEQYLGHLKESAGIMLKVINQILDFSKIESGAMELNLVRTDLKTLIENCCRKLKVTADSKKLELICELDPLLPGFCLLDDLKLEQILINLMGNAVKFTNSGFVKIRVDVLHTMGENGLWKIRFSVQDTGIGVSPDQQQRIFQPFSQGDNSISRKYGGTGLGLSITNKILALMDSTLTLTSEPGKGSIFYFDLSLSS